MKILLLMLLAHLIGDFVLQPTSWVEEKVAKKIKSTKLYLHILIHSVLLLILIGTSVPLWAIGAVVVTHYLIDLGKLYGQVYVDWRKLFWFDQLLHLIVIAGVAYYLGSYSLETPFRDNALKMILAFVLLWWVSSVIVQVLISEWRPHTEDKEDESLARAGSFIGKLERLFVFAFVVSGNLGGIGFLLAAKSVFRFGDLKESKDRKLTEYMLIGTLLSFGMAMLIGWWYMVLEF